MGQLVKPQVARICATFRKCFRTVTVPQVTHESFIGVVDELIAEGAGGISSHRALAKRLAQISGIEAESWRRALGRYRAGVNPTEETIALFARAFRVERDRFPTARQPARLAELAEAVAEVAEAHTEQELELAALDERLRVVEVHLGLVEDEPMNPPAEGP